MQGSTKHGDLVLHGGTRREDDVEAVRFVDHVTAVLPELGELAFSRTSFGVRYPKGVGETRGMATQAAVSVIRVVGHFEAKGGAARAAAGVVEVVVSLLGAVREERGLCLAAEHPRDTLGFLVRRENHLGVARKVDVRSNGAARTAALPVEEPAAGVLLGVDELRTELGARVWVELVDA